MNIDVFEENWEAVQVFTRCRQDYIASMAGAHALSFSALEIDAGCRLVGVAAARLPEVSEHVREMGVIAARALNERSAS